LKNPEMIRKHSPNYRWYVLAVTGLANTISMVGAFLAPPIGNSLADINPGYPFFFWSALSAVSLPMAFFIKNRTGQS
jgi:hypothetical protein